MNEAVFSKLNQDFTYASGGAAAGKGGKGGEDPDTLKSEAVLMVEFIIGSGPVQGYIDQEELERNLYFNETPVRNEDGTLNFENVKAVFVEGVQYQNQLPGFTGRNQTDVDVNATVRKDQGKITRFVNDDSANLIRLTLQIPGLVETTDKGAKGTSVTLNVTITDSSGTIITRDPAGNPGAYDWTVDGKTTSLYEEDREWTLTGASPYKIEVERITDDPENSELRNDTVWSRYTLVNFDRLRHPYSAKLGVQLTSREFNGIPTIGLRGKWLLCRIPHNYDPIARTYSGIFNGSFTPGVYWTNNPAYVLRELLNNHRFGLGEELENFQHNDYALYEIGKYCDELVDDGFGGQEPRFTANGFQSNAEEADKFVTKFLEICHSLWFYANSKIEYLQDRPQEPVRIYTEANTLENYSGNAVSQPCFEYQGVAKDAIHTAGKLRFRNKLNLHKEDYAYYGNEGLIRRYSYNLLDIDMPWIDSYGQGMRHIRWKVLTEAYDQRIVKFKVFNEGILEYPGSLIQIADPARQGGRKGGRLKGIDAHRKIITLDAPVQLIAGRAYTWGCAASSQTFTVDLSESNNEPHVVRGTGFSLALMGARVGAARVVQVLSSVQLVLDRSTGLGTASSADVSFGFDMLAISRPIINPGNTTTDTLELVSPLPFDPVIGTTWFISDNVQPLPTYRVISVSRQEDSKRGATYEIQAISSTQSKYDEIDDLGKTPGQGLDRTRRPKPPSIDKVNVIESGSQLIISWTTQRVIDQGTVRRNHNQTAYIVRYRRNNDNWTRLPATNQRSVQVDIAQTGNYQAQVAVVDYLGVARWSPTVAETGEVLAGPALTVETQTVDIGLTELVSATTNRKVFLGSIKINSPNTGIVKFASGSTVQSGGLNITANVEEFLENNTTGIFITQMGESLGIESDINDVTIEFGWRLVTS